MKQGDIFDNLNSSTELSVRRKTLVAYLKSQVGLSERGAERELAYRLAGLMSSRTCRELSTDDPCLAILFLAGELELPGQHQVEGSSWERLVELANALK